ncbi:MAG TPA: hypothetical protein VFX43_00320 [Chitinophagaceae bacterium]|nr:hypothetical protein [Chitinophagaceae bacterium]
MISDAPLLQGTRRLCSKIVGAAAEGPSAGSSLWYEKDGDSWAKEKTLAAAGGSDGGFMNTYENSGDAKYLYHVLNGGPLPPHTSNLPMEDAGEGVTGGHSSLPGQDKTALWKCP